MKNLVEHTNKLNCNCIDTAQKFAYKQGRKELTENLINFEIIFTKDNKGNKEFRKLLLIKLKKEIYE